MLVKLNISRETDKAYMLNGGGWIPKSVLDNRGLIHPYYQIKGWFLQAMVKKIYEKEITNQEKESLEGITKCKIKFSDLPKNVSDFWQKYWSDAYNSIPDKPKPIFNKYKNKRRISLDNYNDIGAMNGLSFQDLYGH